MRLNFKKTFFGRKNNLEEIGWDSLKVKETIFRERNLTERILAFAVIKSLCKTDAP